MIEFPGHESARRRGAMSDTAIEDNWNRVFGKRLGWLDLKKIYEAWV